MVRYGSAAVTDADREVAAGRLREQYAAGRLSLDEFQERLDGVYKAQTARDLGLATEDPLYDGRVLQPGAPWGSDQENYPFGVDQLQATMARVGRRVKLALGVMTAGTVLFVALLIIAIVHGGLLGVAATILLTIFAIGAAGVGTVIMRARRFWRSRTWLTGVRLR
jgi:Domain of unknown function (DUF1707)